MGSPPGASARGAARRDQILASALEVIRASPAADVQLADIARHAGIHASNVLYYFGSRDEVLVAAVTHAEQRLAEGRAERLAAIADPAARLAAFAREYLPDDHRDPVWKLWIEGWVRSESHAEFAAVGFAADTEWHRDLVACLEHAAAHGLAIDGEIPDVARRALYLLDGLAVHVLARHLTPEAALEIATATLRRA